MKVNCIIFDFKKFYHKQCEGSFLSVSEWNVAFAKNIQPKTILFQVDTKFECYIKEAKFILILILLQLDSSEEQISTIKKELEAKKEKISEIEKV